MLSYFMPEFDLLSLERCEKTSCLASCPDQIESTLYTVMEDWLCANDNSIQALWAVSPSLGMFLCRNVTSISCKLLMIECLPCTHVC